MVSCGTGEIIRFNGPLLSGANPDIIIFRRSLKNRLLSNKVVIAGDGYRDHQAVTKDKSVGFKGYHSE